MFSKEWIQVAATGYYNLVLSSTFYTEQHWFLPTEYTYKSIQVWASSKLSHSAIG